MSAVTVALGVAAPPNVSGYSDVYGVRVNTSPRRVLIVDGFDRNDSTASNRFPSHPFAMTHGQSILTDFATAANEAVVDSSVPLRDYDMGVWVLVDESEADESFSAREQELVKEFLRRGGKLFVSGSELAFDLDRIACLQGEARLQLKPLRCQIEDVTGGGHPIQRHQSMSIDWDA